MKRILFILISCVTLMAKSQSQAVNPRSIYPNGVAVQIGGPTFALSLSMNHYFTKNWNLEAGLGFIGAYGGVKYFWGKPDKTMRFSPYLGSFWMYAAVPFDGIYHGMNIPLGVQLMAKRGFVLSLDVSFNTFGTGYSFPWGGIHIGKNFQ